MTRRMSIEIAFVVEEDPDGGLVARALGEPIVTQADDFEILRSSVRDAVRCHFPDEDTRPRLIRLHSVRDEVILVRSSRATSPDGSSPAC